VIRNGAPSVHHTLSMSDFAQLATGYGSARTVALLWTTERSRRLVLLRMLLAEVSACPELLGPLPSAESAWEVLTAAHEATPSDIDGLLLGPQLGNWAAHTLRRRHGGAEDDVPHWIDFGAIHAVGLVAAYRAGLSWRTRIPLRHGRVMLPDLGLAYFPSDEPWSIADATVVAGRIELTHDGRTIAVPAHPELDAEGWWGLRRHSAVAAGTAFTVAINDLDPFRDLADPVPPARLDDAAFAQWSNLLDEAWHILVRDDRESAEALAIGVVSIAPLPSGEHGDGTRSASAGDAFGSVMTTLPPDAPTFAVTLVHEFQHIKLGALMHLLTLTEDRPTSDLYAPWRDDPRPLPGLLQGLYAFFGIAHFWRVHRLNATGVEERRATFEFAYSRAQTREALAEVERVSANLTPRGRQLLDGLTATFLPWLNDDVDPRVLMLAQTVSDGHRAGWRIRHLRPDPADVDALVKTWHAGNTAELAPIGCAVQPDPTVRWSQGLLGLARTLLLSPDRYDEIELTAGGWTADLTTADLALMAGDVMSACEGYLANIAADPGSTLAWRGLSLALPDNAPATARTALRHRPEIVRAVYRGIAATSPGQSPVAIAAWVGTADWVTH
jgi:HEXXH motif-containing protein